MYIPPELIQGKVKLPISREEWDRHVVDIARKHGIGEHLTSSHDNELDAFRHIYTSAIITRYAGKTISELGGDFVEFKGDIIDDQHPAIKEMDQSSNALGRQIGQISENVDEIAERTAKAIKEKRTFLSPPYPNPFEGSSTPTPVFKPDNFSEKTSSANDSVFTNISRGFSSFFPNNLFSRTSNLNIESLLGAELSRSADSIVERIIGRNPNMFQASAGRFLSQSVERFGKALNEGRIRDFEDAFTSVLGGKNGAMGFATDIGNQVMGGLLQTGLDKLFGAGKTTTSSFESARSLQAAQNYRMSRGQQAAEALTQLHKGQRNL